MSKRKLCEIWTKFKFQSLIKDCEVRKSRKNPLLTETYTE